MLAAAAALLLSGALFLRFTALERRSRTLSVVLWVLAVLLVESVLWPSPNRVPDGLFHPEFPTSFRLLDTVVLAAIAARVVGRGFPRQLGGAELLWGAFLVWLAVQAALGLSLGNDPTLVLFEAKAVAYLGLLCVSAGVRPAELAARSLDRFLLTSGGVAAVVVLLDRTGRTFAFALPLLEVEEVGEVGSDLATVLTLLGLLSLSKALADPQRRLPLLCASAPMLMAGLVSGQRAAVLALLIGLAIVVTLTLRSGSRLRLPGGDLVVLGLLVTALLVAPAALRSPQAGTSVTTPVFSTVQQTFTSQGKQLSAQGRLNQWREVRPLLAERPILGWGLGRTYRYWEPGPREFVTSNITHNVAMDLVLRTGAAGLLFFLLALAATVLRGLRSLQRLSDPALTAVAVALLGTVGGWMGKGMVESLFEKFRLAVLLGLVLGLLLSLDRTGAADDEGADAHTPLTGATT